MLTVSIWRMQSQDGLKGEPMSKKELNTNEVEADMSLSGQLSRRRRLRRLVEINENEESLSSAELQENEAEPENAAEREADLGNSTCEDGYYSSKDSYRDKAQQDKKIRVTMLGISGCGKTSFLSGVYQSLMVASFRGLSLVTSAEADDSFQQVGRIADIALINRKGYDFADGTLETAIFPLTLQNRGKDVCNFDFTDYAGGDILDILNAQGDMSSGAKALKNQLLQSDAVLVFADATMLCQGRNVVEWQRLTGAAKLNPLFNLLSRAMGDRPLTVLFVLTKTDDERIPKEMKANNFAQLSERAVQAFGMIYQIVQDHIQDGWSFGVIPVSAIGEGNYRLAVSYDLEGKQIVRPVVKEGHAPEPYNIETALVYAVACILSQWKKEMDREKENLTRRLIEEGRNNTMMGNFISQWKKRPRPEEKVAGILNEIEEKNKEIVALSAQMNDLVEQAGVRQRIQRYRDHLEENGGNS